MSQDSWTKWERTNKLSFLRFRHTDSSHTQKRRHFRTFRRATRSDYWFLSNWCFNCSCTNTPKSWDTYSSTLSRSVVALWWALSRYRQGVTSQCSLGCSLQIAYLSSSSHSSSPVMVHSSWAVHNYSTVPMVSLSFAPVSMFTTNSDCCMFHSVLHNWRRLDSTNVPSSCCGVWEPWSVEHQSCKLAMVLYVILKQTETGFVPTSAQFFAVRTLLILISPSWTLSCTRVTVCFIRCLAPSWSRERIRRRTVTLYFNLHWNSQIVVYRSQR